LLTHDRHRHHLEVMIVWAIKNPAEAGLGEAG